MTSELDFFFPCSGQKIITTQYIDRPFSDLNYMLGWHCVIDDSARHIVAESQHAAAFHRPLF